MRLMTVCVRKAS